MNYYFLLHTVRNNFKQRSPYIELQTFIETASNQAI